MTLFKERFFLISWPLILLTLTLVVVLDQFSKLLILDAFQRGEQSEVIPGFFNLTLQS